MIRFKQYLKEGPPAWTESLSTMIFDLPRAGLKDLKIPLSPAIFKRVWPEPVRSRVFHVTDFTGVGKLKKMQGKKKSISAFYNITPSEISYGIKTEGGYAVEMDADVLVAAPDDISSQPDKTGRRWLTWSTILKELGGGSKIKRMGKDLEKLLRDIIVKYGDDSVGVPDVNTAWGHLHYESDNKNLSLIIKDYIDGMEKIMKKYSKPLRSIFTDYAKDRKQKPDPDSGDFALWDEVVVNNFKIVKIHVGPEFAPDFEDDDDIDGFPFQGWDDEGDLADYITRTALKKK